MQSDPASSPLTDPSCLAAQPVSPNPEAAVSRGVSSQADAPPGIELHPDLYAKIIAHLSFTAWAYADSCEGQHVDLDALDRECSVSVVEAFAITKCDLLRVNLAQRFRIRDEFMTHFYLRRLGDKAVAKESLLVMAMQANAVNRETIRAQQVAHAEEVSKLRGHLTKLRNEVARLATGGGAKP